MQAFSLTTGQAVADFVAPNPDAQRGNLKANGRGIAVVGTRIYYSFAGLPNVYASDTVTHADLGIAFCTPLPGVAALSWDGSALWVVPYGALQPNIPSSLNVYRYSPSGTLLATVAVPEPPDFNGRQLLPRDGFAATPFGFVTDQNASVPYSTRDFTGKLLNEYFITSPDRSAGITFDGAQYIVSAITLQNFDVYDVNGTFVRTVHLSGAPIPIGIEGVSTVN